MNPFTLYFLVTKLWGERGDGLAPYDITYIKINFLVTIISKI